MGIPGHCGWGCVSVWCGGREGAGLPHLAGPLSAQLSAPLLPGCLLWLWARSWVLELLGLEEQRAAKWDWPDRVTGWEADGKLQQLGRRRHWASSTLTVPCAVGGWGARKDR